MLKTLMIQVLNIFSMRGLTDSEYFPDFRALTHDCKQGLHHLTLDLGIFWFHHHDNVTVIQMTDCSHSVFGFSEAGFLSQMMNYILYLYFYFFSQHCSPAVISTQHVWPLLHNSVHYHLNKWSDSIQHCQKQRKAFINFTYMSALLLHFIVLLVFYFQRWGEKTKSNQTKTSKDDKFISSLIFCWW